jgi:hypothetical protein
MEKLKLTVQNRGAVVKKTFFSHNLRMSVKS